MWVFSLVTRSKLHGRQFFILLGVFLLSPLFSNYCLRFQIDAMKYYMHFLTMSYRTFPSPLLPPLQVYDDLASADAQGLFRFLQRRGYIGGEPDIPVPALIRDATPLTGVDMIEVRFRRSRLWRLHHSMHFSSLSPYVVVVRASGRRYFRVFVFACFWLFELESFDW